jgi:hypothetical protein
MISNCKKNIFVHGWMDQNKYRCVIFWRVQLLIRSRHQLCHAMLNLMKAQHPHTGDVLAGVNTTVMKTWNIPVNKVGLLISEIGSNMI